MSREISGHEALVRLAGLAAGSNLRAYLRLTWKFFQQGGTYIPTWAGDAICDHVEAWIRGEIDRLGIEVPPGSGKTSRASIAAPVWSWLLDPTARWMCGSYDLVYAARLNAKRRRLLLEKPVRAITQPQYDLLRGEKSRTYFMNDNGGWMAAVSPNGGVTTGEHCKFMVLDDLVKAGPTATPQVFREVEEFISGTLLSRFRDQNNPKIMYVGQRLGRGDPQDVLYDHGPLPRPGREGDDGPLFNDFQVLTIPAEYDPKRSKVTVLGFRDPRTVEGESFSRERYGVDHLREKRRNMGADYDPQYNQLVRRTDGGIFQRHWFPFWGSRPNLERAEWASFTDCTFAGGPGSDYVVIQVWAAVGGFAYLMDQIRGQMGITDTCKAMLELVKRWPQCGRWMVENRRAANGDGVVDLMRRMVPGVIGVSYEQGQNKLARAKAFQPMAEAGQIFLPDPSIAPWVTAWLDELCAFTGQDGQQDDQVDAASGALNWLRSQILESLAEFHAAEVVQLDGYSRPRRGW